MTITMMGMSALSGLGDVMSTRRETKAMEAQANENARGMEREGADAMARARFDQAQIRRERDQSVASQRATQAGRGGLVDVGGNADVVGETVANYALDEKMRGREGQAEASALRTQADNTRKKAKYEGKAKRRNAIFGAVDGVLGAGAQGLGGGPGGFSGLFG